MFTCSVWNTSTCIILFVLHNILHSRFSIQGVEWPFWSHTVCQAAELELNTILLISSPVFYSIKPSGQYILITYLALNSPQQSMAKLLNAGERERDRDREHRRETKEAGGEKERRTWGRETWIKKSECNTGNEFLPISPTYPSSYGLFNS